MDPIKILKRAWKILWSYKALWIFGIILALTTSGSNFRFSGNNASSGSDSSSSSSGGDVSPSQSFREGIQDMKEFWNEDLPELFTSQIPQDEVRTLVVFGIIFLVFVVLTGIVLTFARYIAETAVIRMVDEYEATGNKPGIRQGFRFGWSRTSWRMFLINLLVNLPIFLIVLLMLAVGVATFLLVTQDSPVLTITSVVGGIGFFFLSIFVLSILGVVIRLLVEFFWRACALEQVGVRESIRMGWNLVRKNLGSVALMWLVMFGVSLVWIIFVVIAFFILLPILALTIVAGAIVGGLPGLLFAGISSLFLSGYWPWIVGAVAGLPLFALVAFSPLIFLGGLERVFTSTVWTLVYRELKALPVLGLVAEPEPEIESLSSADNLTP
jgi:hypothetical protein